MDNCIGTITDDKTSEAGAKNMMNTLRCKNIVKITYN